MEAGIISSSSFPPIARAEWLGELRRQSLRAAAPPTPSYAELRLEELRTAPGQPDALRRAHANWSIVQRIDDVDPKRANAQAQEDVARGATGLAIIFEAAPNAFGYGLPARPEALAAALHNIPLNRVSLRIDVHPSSRASVDWIVELMRRKRVDPARVSLSFGIDPAAIFAGNGSLRMSIEALRASMPQSLAHFFAMSIPAILLEADGRVLHNAGASEVQELGFMLASAVSHLRMFQEARQPLVYAVPHIGFALSIDQDQYLSLAKLRALRRLWARLQEACRLAPAPARIHVETSYRMLVSDDAETNIIRSSLAAQSAAAGGADTICVLPHSLPIGLPNGRARSMARSVQQTLGEETSLSFLGDPTQGSEDIDVLTASLCEAAWNEFRLIESEGGLLESLLAGHIQNRVRATLDRRAAAMRERMAEQPQAGGDTPSRSGGSSTLKATRREPTVDGVVHCERMMPIRLEELVVPPAA